MSFVGHLDRYTPISAAHVGPATPTLFTIFPAYKPKLFPGNRVKQLHFDGGEKRYVNVPQIRTEKKKTTVNMCERGAAGLCS